MRALSVFLCVFMGFVNYSEALADPLVAFSNVPPPGNYKPGGTTLKTGALKAILFTTPVTSETEIVSIKAGLTFCAGGICPSGPGTEHYPSLADFQLSLYSVSDLAGVPTPDTELYSIPMQYGLTLTQRGTLFTFNIPNWRLSANTTYALVATSTDSGAVKWSNVELGGIDYPAQAENGFSFTVNPGFITNPLSPTPYWQSAGAATNNAVQMKVLFVPSPAPIPTLSEWVEIMMMLLMILTVAWYFRKQQN